MWRWQITIASRTKGRILPPKVQPYDVYDYIARMHYRNHISKDMTHDEIEKVKDDLVTRLAAGTSKNTEFDTKHFDDYLEEYCQENGINRGQYAS